MKTLPCGLWGGISGLKVLACSSVALCAVLNIASADLIMDLRVGSLSGAGSLADDKTVLGVDVGSIITLQVWAQITAAGTTQINDTFGLQRVMGSIISTSSPASGGNVRGNMSPAQLFAPYDSLPRPIAAFAGQVAELSAPADGSLDLGGNGTTPVSNTFIIFRADPFTGELIRDDEYAIPTNNVPVGATVNAITDGYEFLLGTADFTVNTILDEEDPAIALNWVIPPFTSPANKGMRALWVQGNGVVVSGNMQANLMSVGDPVTISAASAVEAIPEPGTCVAILGGMAVLGLRRGRHRLS